MSGFSVFPAIIFRPQHNVGAMTNLPVSSFETASAHGLVASIASGRLSAREACDDAIARIERLDARINAVVVRDFERAREQAAMRDRQLAQGERRPLLGLPMTVKESLDVAGLPTTWGLLPFRDFRPQNDALAIERLKAAGAVILGKTNVPPSLADWQCTNPVYGRTVNPCDVSRSPGGSSGGSAAALAANMVALECGSDIGGSIRVPSAFCGVFGLKPSFGLVPEQGHAFPGTDGARVELAVVGPMARNVIDLEIALGVLAGAGSMDAVGWRASLPAPKARSLAECKLLILDDHPRARTDMVIRDALESLCGRASRAGAKVVRESSLLPDLGPAHDDYVRMLMAIVTHGARDVDNVISAHEWFDLLNKQIQVRRQWQALFERHDAVITPAFGTVAYPHVDQPDMVRSTLVIDREPTPYGAQLAWPGVATFANLPATSAPIGFTHDRLPIGVQVIGPYLHDRSTLHIAGWLSALP